MIMIINYLASLSIRSSPLSDNAWWLRKCTRPLSTCNTGLSMEFDQISDNCMGWAENKEYVSCREKKERERGRGRWGEVRNQRNKLPRWLRYACTINLIGNSLLTESSYSGVFYLVKSPNQLPSHTWAMWQVSAISWSSAVGKSYQKWDCEYK